uniref:Uncharacterized protein n=1 Tax=Macrostomum lignano TaxID=282301 RepID=A0A1I8F4S0_9PLAT
MRVGDVVLEVKAARLRKRKRGNSPQMEEASGTSGTGSAGVHCERHSQSAEEVCAGSRISHRLQRRLELVEDVAQPELRFAAHNAGTGKPSRSGLRPATALTWPANASGVANSCSSDRAVSLPAEAQPAVAMPAASLMPPSSTSSRPTSWHTRSRRRSSRSARGRRAFWLFQALRSGGPQPARPPHRARASDPDVAATIQGRGGRRRRQLPAGGRQTRLSGDDLLDSPSDDNNDTGENGGGVVEILDGVHGGGGPAEDEEDDDATIVEDESTAAPLQQLSRSAMVN